MSHQLKSKDINMMRYSYGEAENGAISTLHTIPISQFYGKVYLNPCARLTSNTKKYC